jgi:hypothetical protein
MLLILLFFFIGAPILAQNYLLVGQDLYQPAVTRCVNPDIIVNNALNQSDCLRTFRSDGCNYQQLNCILSISLGYQFGNFMKFTKVMASAVSPGVNDGILNFTVQYVSLSVASVNGYVQLWQYVSTNAQTGIDSYEFTERQVYIFNPPNVYPTYTFNDLYSGKYQLVYWDVGGTRYGSGTPEVSGAFILPSWLPQDYELFVAPVPQGVSARSPYAQQCAYVAYDAGGQAPSYFSAYPDSRYYGYKQDYSTMPSMPPYSTIPGAVYLSYSLQSTTPGLDLTYYLLNAQSVHNRVPLWEWRSDQGNIINVKTAPLPPAVIQVDCNYCNANANMTKFCNACSTVPGFSSPACASCTAGKHNPPQFCDYCPSITGGGLCSISALFDVDSMLTFKINPMITGSYGVATGEPVQPDPTGDNPNGYFPWQRLDQGRKSHMAFKLGYKGMANTQYVDYWRMRQGFGRSTIVASRVLDMVQVDITPVYSQFPHPQVPYNPTGKEFAGCQKGFCSDPECQAAPCPNPNFINPDVFTVMNFNHIETSSYVLGDQQMRVKQDLFVTYFYPEHPVWPGMGGAGGQMGLWSDYYSWNDQYRNLFYWPNGDPTWGINATAYYNSISINSNKGDWTQKARYVTSKYVPGATSSIFGAQLFKFKVSFVNHTNTDDYSCRPVNTDYANAQITNNHLLINPEDPYSPKTSPNLYNPSRTMAFTYADIKLGTKWLADVVGDCMKDASAVCDANAIPPQYYMPSGCTGNGVNACCDRPLWDPGALSGGKCPANVGPFVRWYKYFADRSECFLMSSPTTPAPGGGAGCCFFNPGVSNEFPVFSWVCSRQRTQRPECQACCGHFKDKVANWKWNCDGNLNGYQECSPNANLVPCTSPNPLACPNQQCYCNGGQGTRDREPTTLTEMICTAAVARNPQTDPGNYAYVTSIHVGTSFACNLFRTYSGAPSNQGQGFFGAYNSDASNGNNPNIPPFVPFNPSAMSRWTYGNIKECSVGPMPLYYVNANSLIKSGSYTPGNSLSNLFWQANFTYTNRRAMIDADNIDWPIFLIPSQQAVDNPFPKGGIQTQALAYDRPPIWANPRVGTTPAPGYSTSGGGAPGGWTQGTLGLDTQMVSVMYRESILYTLVDEGATPTDYVDQVVCGSEDGQDLCGQGNNVVWNNQVWASYARFRVYPNIVFRSFTNAIPQRGSIPTSINIEFRVSCPFLGFQFFGPDDSTPAYCAEGWYITNQNNNAILLGVYSYPATTQVQSTGGTLPDTDPLAVIASAQLNVGPMGVPVKNQILAGSYDGDVWVLTIAYQNGDVLHWGFNVRSEPEWTYGTASGVCRNWSTTDVRSTVPTSPLYYVPDTITVPVPPQQYVFLPMIARVAIAAPACVYNSAEMQIFVVNGQFYAWDVIIRLNLPQIGVNAGGAPGIGINSGFVFYYYVWTLINQSVTGGANGNNPNATVQGFAEQFQTYSPPFDAEVCDHIMCIRPQMPANMYVPPPVAQNPLKRNPMICTTETINNATCNVNLENDPTFEYSGINQQPFCDTTAGTGNGPAGTRINSVLLVPRLIFNPPYSLLQNVGPVVFNVSTSYVDPLFYSLTTTGIFEQQNQFLVSEARFPGQGSVFMSLWVNYGLTIASFFEPFCYENLLAQVYILSSFVASLGPIEYIDGCTRADNCCYFLPITVSGTSPFNGIPVTLTGVSAPYNQLGNQTDLCFGTPECLYEVVISPTPFFGQPGGGGLCLGVSYQFTIQTPQAIVNVRQALPLPFGPNGTVVFNTSDFHYAYRCPDVFTFTMPVGGFSPVDVVTIPGTCVQPGTVVTFTFTYTDPICTGPITAANPVPACALNLYFALVNTDGQTSYTNSAPTTPGHGITLGAPYLINGIYAFTFNVEGQFVFPTFFTPSPEYPFGGFPPVPNGYWKAYFWVQPAGAAPQPPAFGYGNITDGRQTTQAPFLASLQNTDGVAISRTFLFRPRCPGNATDPNPIKMGFTVTDLSYNGPYVVTFTDPSGAIINQQNYTCDGFACPTGPGTRPCIDIDTTGAISLITNPAQRLAACSLIMTTTGFSLVAQIGTGPYSPGISGGYTLMVGALGSQCGNTYTEFMQALTEIVVQQECYPATCYGGLNGWAQTVITGGTPYTVLQQQQVLGSHFDVWLPLYNFTWQSPLGTQYNAPPSLLRVPMGWYYFNVTDANGCAPPAKYFAPVPATNNSAGAPGGFFSGGCSVNSSTPQIQLQPVGTGTRPNCSGLYGSVSFTVEPPGYYTLQKISNNSVTVAAGYEILTDSTVVPDTEVFYVVVNELGCISPEVSFTLGGPLGAFNVGYAINIRPCGAQSGGSTNTGSITALVTPPGLGTTLVWTNMNTGQVVGGNDPMTIGQTTISGLPAGTYKLTATSQLYGCTGSVLIPLISAGVPSISVTRTSMSVTVDMMRFVVLSDNGPPYQVSYYGRPARVQPNFGLLRSCWARRNSSPCPTFRRSRPSRSSWLTAAGAAPWLRRRAARSRSLMCCSRPRRCHTTSRQTARPS